MNEPLVCWASLLVVLLWALFSNQDVYQEKIKTTLGKYAVFVQWYIIAGFFLFLFFIRTLWDVIWFEYVADHFLDPAKYLDHLNSADMGLSDDEKEALKIPSFLRWISLMSPIVGLLTFGVASFQSINAILVNHGPAEEKRSVQFLKTLIIGMPLVFVAMSLRATIREWAVMTGSAWTTKVTKDMHGATPAERTEQWESLKALEIATYEQDLQVAAAFQFFAVGAFGQVCSRALANMVNNNNNEDVESRRLSSEQIENRKKDGRILRQLAVVGLHAFVGLGFIKTVFNIVVAMISSSPHNLPLIEPIQTKVIKTLDPVFLFATVLSVINMLLLGKMEEVKDRLPGANTKFNATRALLLIGQGQFTFIRAFVTTGGNSPAIKAIEKITKANVKFNFGIHQARLLHSSLLCFECFIVAILNYFVWQTNENPRDGLSEPLTKKEDE